MVDQIIINMIENLPNVAIAAIVLYWYEQRIKHLLDVQSKLTDRLMENADVDRQAVEDVRDLVGAIVHQSKVKRPSDVNRPPTNSNRYGPDV